MRFLVVLFVILSASACSPTINSPGPNAIDHMFDESQARQQATLDAELDALQRKAEILGQIHSYSPFIRVQNVYLPSKQLSDGVYVQARVVSVPMIFNQRELRYSDEAVDRLLAEQKAPKAPEETKPAIQYVPVPVTEAPQPTQEASEK